MTGSKQTGKNIPHTPFPIPHSPSPIKTLTPFPIPHSPSPIKRGMAAALWAIVLFLVMAVTAQAQVCQIGATNYATLDAALAAHTNGQTIRLLANINHNTYIEIYQKSITFDLNGKTLNVNSTTYAGLSVINNGEVNLTGTGQLNCTGIVGVNVSDNSKAVVTNAYGTISDGILCKEGGEILVLGNASTNGTSAFGAHAIFGGKITIDGTINSAGVYIGVGNMNKPQSHYEPVTTKAGYLTYTDGTSTVWVKGEGSIPVCEIGATKYTTLDAALAAHTNGQTIRLLADFDHNSGIEVNGKTLIFDINGKRMTVDNQNPLVLYGAGLSVINGGKIEYVGGGLFNAQGYFYGVYAHGVGSKVTVFNARATGPNSVGAYAAQDSEVIVEGTSSSAGAQGGGAYAVSRGKIMTVTAYGDLFGAYANGYSKITVTNSAWATGSGGIGAFAENNGEVNVLVDVKAEGANSIGAKAESSGNVTIDGSITVPAGSTYITVGTTNKTATQYEATTSKVGYLTYTDGTSTVWVKGETPSPTKTVIVGAQNSAVIAGSTSSVTFPVTTTNINNGAYPVTLTGQPFGITAANLTINANQGTLTINLPLWLIVASYPITITIDGTKSNSFNIVVTSSPTGVCEIVETNTKYLTLSAALMAANNRTVRLLENINHNDYFELDDARITFDLNGKILTVGEYIAMNGSNIRLQGAGELNATDGLAVQVGSAEVTNVTGALGIYVSSGNATAYGIVTVSGANQHGVWANNGASTITIKGNVTTTGAGSTGALATNGGKVTIDGTLTVPAGATYICVGSVNKTKDDFAATTTKAGYLTYTDGTSTVWVKGETPVTNPVCEIGATKYTTLSAALAAHTNGQTIRLLDNIEHNTGIVINGKTITFDLNGKTLNVSSSSGCGLEVSNGGIVNQSGSGNFNISSSTSTGVYVTGNGSKATVTNATTTVNSAGVSANDGCEVTVLGTATGSYGVYCSDAKITVENANGIYFGVYASGSGSHITVRNVNSTSSGCVVYATGSGEVTVLGDVTASGSGIVGAHAYMGGNITIEGTLTATGGATYIAVGLTGKTEAQYVEPTTKAGYLTYTDGTSTVWVKGEADPACSIGTSKYKSLDAALAAHINGQTIRLLKDIDHNAGISINNKLLNFDLNGKILNINAPTEYALYVINNGQVNLIGSGQLNCTGIVGAYISANSKATVTNAYGTTGDGALSVGSELIVLGNVSSYSTTSFGAHAVEGGKITVDGTIQAAGVYIGVGNMNKSQSNYEAVTTKAGYLTYTDGTSTVWVKGEMPSSLPVITTHPASQTVNAGQTVSFSITATGATSYLWLMSPNNGVNWLSLSDGGNASGTTTTTLTIANLSPYWTGYLFRCDASNTAGRVLSDIATLTVNAPPSPPVFSAQPTDQTITEGESVSFTAIASGAASYQWFVSAGAGASFVQVTDNSIFSGATSSTLTLTNVPLSYNGYRFGCTATNAAGATAGSVAVTLTVNPAASTSMLSLSASSLDFTTAGGQLSFDITSNTSWEVSRSATWLTVSPASGTGDGTVRVTVAANTANNARTATITISGAGISEQTIIVTQEGTVSNEQLRITNYELRGWMANGTLNVSGLIAGKPWSVYSIGGQLVYTGIATDDKASIRLSTKGIYIIVQENRRAKIINN